MASRRLQYGTVRYGTFLLAACSVEGPTCWAKIRLGCKPWKAFASEWHTLKILLQFLTPEPRSHVVEAVACTSIDETILSL